MDSEQKALNETEKEAEANEIEQNETRKDSSAQNQSSDGQDDTSPENNEQSINESQENQKPRERKQYSVRVVEVIQMPSYFWGNIKAMVTIKIPGFTIRGIRVVQEEGEEVFKIYPPREFIARRERSIIKIHDKRRWSRIYQEVSKAYLASRAEWDKQGQQEQKGAVAEALSEAADAEE